jgi:NitT/TauT family transport system permease protein
VTTSAASGSPVAAFQRYWARQRKWLAPTVASVLIVISWQVVVTVFKPPSYVLPGPVEVVQVSLGYRASLLDGTWITTLEILEGFLAAIAVSVPAAALVVMVPWVERTLYPLLVIFQTIPKIALAPLFVVWFGFGTFPKVLVTFLICFFPILLDTITGLRSADSELVDLMRSMGGKKWRIFKSIRFPVSLPSLFTGLKVGITLAVAGAIVAEFVGSTRGLGFLLLQANANLVTPLLFGAILILTVLGLVLFYIIAIIERLVIPWHVSQRAQSQTIVGPIA